MATLGLATKKEAKPRKRPTVVSVTPYDLLAFVPAIVADVQV